MKYEDAVAILTSLVRIVESNKFFIDNKPYIPTITCSDAPDSLSESLLKQTTTLPYEENENNIEV